MKQNKLYLKAATAIMLALAGCSMHAQAQSITTLTISGRVFADANGNFILDAAESGTNANGQLYMYLVNAANQTIIDVVALPANGVFSLTGNNGTGHRLELSMGIYAIGTNTSVTPIDHTLPAGWARIGEGVGTTLDGNADGVFTMVKPPPGTTTSSNRNFAIEQLPNSDVIGYTLAGPPASGSTLLLDGSQSPLPAGADPEDGIYSGNTGSINAPRAVQITSLPTNGTLFYYGGSAPQAVTATDIASGTSFTDPSKFYLQFDGSGYTNTIFEYAYVDAAGFRDPTPASYTVNWSTPLPLQFSQFKAGNTLHGIMLEWTTQRERNTEGFYVERSWDGNQWSVIGFVKAANATGLLESAYSFTDKQPKKGKNFYRLKQTDRDGRFGYSTVVNITLEEALTLSLYPNPVRDVLTIEGISGEAMVRVTDPAGRTVMYIGNTISSAKMRLDVSGLRPGAYCLQVEAAPGREILNKMFIKK